MSEVQDHENNRKSPQIQPVKLVGVDIDFGDLVRLFFISYFAFLVASLGVALVVGILVFFLALLGVGLFG